MANNHGSSITNINMVVLDSIWCFIIRWNGDSVFKMLVLPYKPWQEEANIQITRKTKL